MEPAKASSRRCAIYTRKSSEEGLEQDFNSLQAQREACEASIKSQAGEGWRLVRTAYDDGGLSGGTMERPALQRLLGDINHGLIDVVVVYKVDRLTRSLADFAKMVEVCGRADACGASHRCRRDAQRSVRSARPVDASDAGRALHESPTIGITGGSEPEAPETNRGDHRPAPPQKTGALRPPGRSSSDCCDSPRRR